ncbi:NAD(P)/FAD-dependent oxidoreductase [Gimibacter soli]|uniref:NAD(P)/FAD-dependent oxidoreductase n=1 Tax=Gimibacter soli TaxID=3024400 RepID=A0AAE9XQB9_9PROT|nr:NAD(P)/FAD-dependent oxidoreductase [Gimibacter soli]WCL54319.1 NAD(P)/FAD-dependent oxidoreductase [Gimibacter soli]
MPPAPKNFDAVIVGAGAAGLMCAQAAAARGLRVIVLERSAKPGAKILISGGGRCNFTNEEAGPAAYISANPHFAKSALARYTPHDFMDLLARHGVTWHEKKLGQLFSDAGAGRILEILLAECAANGAEIRTGVAVNKVTQSEDGFLLETGMGQVATKKLVVATGGLSIPKLGATGWAYDIARQFGLPIVTPEPALVPFTFAAGDLALMKPLAGVAVDCRVSIGKAAFRENLLFTHRGLSGPAILQISSYWSPGAAVQIDLLPDMADVESALKAERQAHPKQMLKTWAARQWPERFATAFVDTLVGDTRAGHEPLGGLSFAETTRIATLAKSWMITPTGTEGFAKAEVTRGGVATDGLSSKTMEAKAVPGLHFIGECVDVTGWLGGYNFQWAWASGWAAAEAL